jgi:NAD(P)-dependent dehydrogenase (short-subunit alcohol dehydrogenase family)
MTDRIAIVTGASGGIGRAVAARLGHAGMSSVPELTDDENHDDGVSPRAAKRLRDAMDRLLAGRPQRTDGRLLKDNLWKEAGLSRATMNRDHENTLLRQELDQRGRLVTVKVGR